MGLLFVLLFWGVVGLVMAGVGAIVLRILVGILTKGAGDARKRLLRSATLLPFVCLLWVALVFVFQGAVNAVLLHRDIGIGDSSSCPLPNGYAILMIDVSDEGSVYNPKTQNSWGSVSEQKDAIMGVRLLQVAGSYLLGASDSKWFGDPNESTSHVDSYFMIDTRTGERQNFGDQGALQDVALTKGVHLRLEPIFYVYRRYRFTWFDLLAALLLMMPPVTALFLLGRDTLRLRRTVLLNPSFL